MSLLQKGLSFSPVGQYDSFNMDLDLQKLFRNVRLKAYFANQDNLLTCENLTTTSLLKLDDLGLKNKRSFNAPKRFHPVETFVDVVKRDIAALTQRLKFVDFTVSNNLTGDEYKALRSLWSDNDIILKPTDKGGSIVVMDREAYTKEIYCQLSDQETYEKLTSNPTSRIKNRLMTLVDIGVQKGLIDNKLAKFLINHDPVVPVLYILPKVHKTLVNPPGRPIVASNNSILTPPSKVLEKILTPYVKQSTSFILDTTSFLNTIKELDNITPSDILVTIDVVSLYTSIKHTLGSEAVERILCNDSSISAELRQFVLEMLDIVLSENYFLIQDYYLQKRGTAMGSNVALPYAN
ncbi:uncharacterized protein [Engystomops pustulosus]|uniref:uncharacterized protein n=1 Tax=Engystomops pustulosus TaxID=76066 RepID=UPI003AFB1B16